MKKAFVILCFIIVFLLLPIRVQAKSKYQQVKEEYETLFFDLENTDEDHYEEWFKKYEKLLDKYPKILKREMVDIIYSEEEIKLMLRVIETEAYQCDFIQKVNVANVLLNRFQDQRFGYLDMIEVITDENQFVYNKKEIADDTINALNFAFEIMDTTNGSIAFQSDEKTETFNGWSYVFYDGKHWFYK